MFRPKCLIYFYPFTIILVCICEVKMSTPSFHSTIFWIFLTIIIIIQTGCTTVLLARNISVHQTPSHLVVNQSAEISCNYTSKMELEEFNAFLLKGVPERKDVCSSNCKNTCKITNSTKEFSCHATRRGKGVTFRLQNLRADQTDIYICNIQTIYPPPLQDHESNNGTLIHVTGVSEVPKCQCPQGGPEYVGMMATIGGLVLYGMVVTATFYYCWAKNKKSKIVRNDYFNMTPWQPNGLRIKHQPGVPARNYTAYRSWEP